jgi:hypothetical protein
MSVMGLDELDVVAGERQGHAPVEFDDALDVSLSG